MKIRTNPSAYFFSESIFMTPDTELEVELSSLTDVQVEDTYEGSITGRLIVSPGDQKKIFDELKSRLDKTGTHSIESKVKEVEEKLKKLPSVEELDNLQAKFKQLKDETEVRVPSFVRLFKAEL